MFFDGGRALAASGEGRGLGRCLVVPLRVAAARAGVARVVPRPSGSLVPFWKVERWWRPRRGMVVRRSARAFAGVCPSGAGSECSWGRGFSPGSRGRAFSFFSGALRVSAGWSLCVAWLGSVDASTGRAAVGFPGWVLGRRLVSAIMKSAPRTIFELSVPVVAVLGRVGAALNGYGRVVHQPALEEDADDDEEDGVPPLS